MKKFKIIIFSTIFIFVLINKAFAVNFSGAATAYEITMTYLQLCESGSTASTCLNPLVIGTGDSGPIDIANTTAGAAAASYGDFKKVPFGKSYTYYQVKLQLQALLVMVQIHAERMATTKVIILKILKGKQLVLHLALLFLWHL